MAEQGKNDLMGSEIFEPLRRSLKIIWGLRQNAGEVEGVRIFKRSSSSKRTKLELQKYTLSLPKIRKTTILKTFPSLNSFEKETHILGANHDEKYEITFGWFKDL